MSKLELWGGHECTVNRVRDIFMDQTVLSGHQERAPDIDAFVALGLKAIRYPILWERIAPRAPDECDWRWTDQRLLALRQNRVRVIAGLIHHGSGPAYVDLLSDSFAPGLARHARRAAERYAWLEDWTPVNEPLTTARFSALYGHWYPHARDELSFWTALLNQIDATRVAMREIRQVNPSARLVQTEDLGRTYAVPTLSRQAEYDNLRRWMTWDLLFGRVTKEHPFWGRLVRLGLERRLSTIAGDPCPPDVIGINHYLTSDRFLDSNLSRYPRALAGGNERQRYVDVEALRVMATAPAGLENACREAWRRYETRLAITEVHNGCTREEQVRWFGDAWMLARRLRTEGVDLCAVTAWSLLGAYDWDSLLTHRRGHYEPGVFDVSSGAPRPTALAKYIQRLSRDEDAEHECGGDGWWRRDMRLSHRPVDVPVRGSRYASTGRRSAPLLVLGASGTLGQAIGGACAMRDVDHVLTTREQIPLGDPARLSHVIEQVRPRAVINATGWVRVDDAEQEAEACRRANTQGAVMLAEVCTTLGVSSVTFSSDLVFDGAVSRPYVETDHPNPLNVYGASKAEAERAILRVGGRALIVRTAAFFSPNDPHNFAAWIVRQLQEGRSADCASDLVVSPTYVPALANSVLDLVIDGENGLWHLTNGAAVSWAEFGRLIARAVQLDPARILARPAHELGWPAARPRYSALGSSFGKLLPELDESMVSFARGLLQSGRHIGLADQPPRHACTA